MSEDSSVSLYNLLEYEKEKLLVNFIRILQIQHGWPEIFFSSKTPAYRLQIDAQKTWQ